MTRRMSGLLDCLRWVSAILVVISHTADLLVARFADTPAALRPTAVYLWAFSAGFGHQAVTVFYVLSGFLVGGPLIRMARLEGSISWKKYSIDRIIRIYLVLIPALLVCFILDRISYRIEPVWVSEFIHDHSGWRIFFGNLLNLQNFYLPFFGSDGPIGTLAVEMWFYILFPMLIAPLCFRYAVWMRVLLVAIAIAVIAALGLAQPAFLYGFVIWGFGVAARMRTTPLFKSPQVPAFCFMLSIFAVRISLRRQTSLLLWHVFVSDLVLATTLSLLLMTVNLLPDARKSLFYWRGHKHLAGFSYSLYATHMPLLFLLTSLCKITTGFGIQDPVMHPSQWLLVLAAVLTCVVFGYMFSLVTERHTAPFRRWTLAKLRIS